MKNPFTTHPKLTKTLITVLIVLVILSVVKNFALKQAIEVAGSKIVGAKIDVKGFSLSLLFARAKIRHLTLYNPPGFINEPLLKIPEITVSVNPWKTLSGKLYFPKVVVSLDEMILVRNKDGQLNLDNLKVMQDLKKQSKDSKGPEAEIQFQIDQLLLNVGKVVYKDFSKKAKPVVQVFNVAIKSKLIKNIDSPAKLVVAILFEAAKPTAIRSVGMMAATTLAGAAFLPAAALGVIVAKDNALTELKHTASHVFDQALALSKEIGEVKKFDKKVKQITAKIYGCDITINIQKTGLLSCKINITARKYMLAKPQIAAGILYQLIEKLK